jgi:hypothetical protein
VFYLLVAAVGVLHVRMRWQPVGLLPWFGSTQVLSHCSRSSPDCSCFSSQDGWWLAVWLPLGQGKHAEGVAFACLRISSMFVLDALKQLEFCSSLLHTQIDMARCLNGKGCRKCF